MIKTLSDLCGFADGRVAVADLDLDSYISTENMLPNKEGITRSAGLPTVSQTQSYQKDSLSRGEMIINHVSECFRINSLVSFVKDVFTDFHVRHKNAFIVRRDVV